jgi:hypothetical protein
MQEAEALPMYFPVNLESTEDLVGAALPPLKDRIAPKAVTIHNATELAEAIAQSPGPLGHELSPADWFDGMVCFQLSS